ncbi:MAG: hypothetical protein AAF004_14925, partial [Pseudomonadota bacterium]
MKNILVLLTAVTSLYGGVVSGDEPAQDEPQPLLIIEDAGSIEDAMDAAAMVGDFEANSGLSFDQYGGVIDAAGDPTANADPDGIVSVMQRSQQELLDKRVALYGSEKAIRITELRVFDMPSYQEWQAANFLAGLNNVDRVIENERVIESDMMTLLPPDQALSSVKCSAYICLLQLTPWLHLGRPEHRAK